MFWIQRFRHELRSGLGLAGLEAHWRQRIVRLEFGWLLSLATFELSGATQAGVAILDECRRPPPPGDS